MQFFGVLDCVSIYGVWLAMTHGVVLLTVNRFTAVVVPYFHRTTVSAVAKRLRYDMCRICGAGGVWLYC